MGDAGVLELTLRALAFTALAGLAIWPLERAFPQSSGLRSTLRADVLFATVGQVLTRLLLALVLGVALSALEQVSLASSPLQLISGGATQRVLDGLCGLLIFELFGYAYHRLAHRVPWLWRLHEVHHSSEAMDWLASFRQHPLEILLLTLAQNAPLVLLGMPLSTHVLLLVALRLNTVFVHANVRVPDGPWRYLIATPRFHHRHHERLGATRNFATLLPCIDLAFGTFSAAHSHDFGLPHRMPEGFWGLLAVPFRRVHEASRTSFPGRRHSGTFRKARHPDDIAANG
jgi:sterol desaturase/sphingolipid hydroxylase (fatty acid hydroxylase superfamily)